VTAGDQHDSVLTITAHATAPTAHGPRGGIASRGVHRDDTRRPRDLPRWDSAVRLVLRVRRVRGLNAICTGQTCAARWPQAVRPARSARCAGPRCGSHLGLRSAAKPGRGWAPRSRCPPAPIPYGGGSASGRIRPCQRRPAVGWRMGPGVVGAPRAPCGWTWSAIGRVTCAPIAQPTRSRPRSGRLQAFTSSAVTARRRRRAAPPLAHPRPHLSSTGGLCSAIGVKPSNGGWIGSLTAWQPS
jgi:hypothetical protein